MNEARGQAMDTVGRRVILAEETARAKAVRWEYAGGIQQKGQQRDKPGGHLP